MGSGQSIEAGDGTIPQKVQDAISSNAVVIFSKTRCPYCIRAKELFQRKQQQFTAVELDEMSDCSALLDYLGNLTGARTVPRVFIRGNCYGGCDDLIKLDRSGELDKILSQR